VNDQKKDHCFISTTYDATTHFEGTTTEVLDMYEAVTGKKIDLTITTDRDKLADPDSLDPAPAGEETEAAEDGASPDTPAEETGKEKTES